MFINHRKYFNHWRNWLQLKGFKDKDTYGECQKLRLLPFQGLRVLSGLGHHSYEKPVVVGLAVVPLVVVEGLEFLNH